MGTVRRAGSLCGLLLLAAVVTGQKQSRTMQSSDLARLPRPAPDHVIAYGPDPLQYAELRLPRRAGRHPVVILIHGGCWQAAWGLDHVRALAQALTAEGYATWSLEYRRIGDPGGGWPGTLEDVARGTDHLRSLAREHAFDLARVVAVGHSAGGQLALWLAARPRVPPHSLLWTAEPLRIAGVVSLAGITDLRAAAAGRVCGDAVEQLLGGAPEALEGRVRAASPIELLPLGVPQRLVCGALDRLVPSRLPLDYHDAAVRAGDAVAFELVDGVGHFELVDPASPAWPALRRAVSALLPPRGGRALP